MNNPYIGNNVQLFDVRQYTFSDGRAKDTRAIDVWNGKNLFVTILPDRCLDLYTVRYKNNSMAYHTANGVVNPAYYNDHDASFLRSFGAGFLATCGLKNYGGADLDNGDITFHGRVGHIPAENLSVDLAEDGKSVVISGTMRESMIFGFDFTLKRTIKIEYGVDKIFIKDEIKNCGYRESHLSMLYHFNMGYPLLSENAKIVIPTTDVKPLTEHAKKEKYSWNKFVAPVETFDEMLFEHKLSENCVGIDNSDINTSMRISFKSDVLDNFLEWKACQAGTYVCGLEPMTMTNSGYNSNKRQGTLKYLKPQQKVESNFEISFTDIK